MRVALGERADKMSCSPFTAPCQRLPGTRTVTGLWPRAHHTDESPVGLALHGAEKRLAQQTRVLLQITATPHLSIVRPQAAVTAYEIGKVENNLRKEPDGQRTRSRACGHARDSAAGASEGSGGAAGRGVRCWPWYRGMPQVRVAPAAAGELGAEPSGQVRRPIERTRSRSAAAGWVQGLRGNGAHVENLVVTSDPQGAFNRQAVQPELERLGQDFRAREGGGEAHPSPHAVAGSCSI